MTWNYEFYSTVWNIFTCLKTITFQKQIASLVYKQLIYGVLQFKLLHTIKLSYLVVVPAHG